MSEKRRLYFQRYYKEHRAEKLRYYKAHRAKVLARTKRCRLRKIDLYHSRESLNCKRWREDNPVKYKAIKYAQNHFPLGDCCEFCGSKVNLMRFLPDYGYPMVFVTVCRSFRAYVRKSLGGD